jgi:hypothetical protein
MTTLASSPITAAGTPTIDVRGPRFAAVVTSIVLATVLVLAPSPVAFALLVAQGLVFASGSVLGVQHTPYSLVFQHLIRPRLGAAQEWEEQAPLRFAQSVGLAFAVIAIAAFVSGAPLVALIAVAGAFAAAALNAITGFCLGCELYLLGKRLAFRWNSDHKF